MLSQLIKKRTPLYSFASKSYDLAVIGGGPGGYVAAIKAAQLGLNTVCIEKRGALGGTCLNVGCIPSKALLNISHKYYQANKHFKEFGIDIKELSLNWGKTQATKDGIVKSLTSGIEHLFKKNKVTYVKGSGAFVNKDTIQVTDAQGNKQTINAAKTIIATGSEPVAFPGLPFDEKIVISSTGALVIPAVPKEMVVIGGGVIGLEMGSVYQRLGTHVTVVEFMDEIVSVMDRQIAKAFHKILTKQGMTILTSTKVIGGKNNGDSAEIQIQSVKGGEKKILKCDHVLVSTGRKPYTDGLGLENAGLQADKKGRIEVNEQLQTVVPNIYAIGDVIRGAMLAHKAEEEGIYVAELVAGKHPHINYMAIPSVIYTHPEVASVGYTEEQLIEKNIEYKKGTFPFMANSRAKVYSDTDGLVKILSDKKTDKMLGAHIVGSGAGEMISEAVIAMEYGASSEDLARTCHAHPTLSEAFKEACMATYSKPIHF